MSPLRSALRAALACGAACVLAAGGCSSDDERADREAGDGAETAGDERGGPPDAASPPRASCPPALSNCRTASGRVIYVERVDPDGDGDAHFVVASGDSITGPGISVIDVRRSLRPSPLPGRGDRLSAAGPVYTGSYGQRQIEAIELNVSRAR